ncbi:MAG: response regulator [Lachnospiraceae bacterium]|nr:response regulator [Lachnospiraceae bacterium]
MYELLIVDDEANSRNILASCFPWNEQGFHICGQADSGREALEHLKSNTVHVVLTDITMPGMNGIELAKTISEFPSSTRPMVVFLSAYDDFKFAQDAIRYGVRYYVLKPTNFSELKEIFGAVKKELDVKYQLQPDFSDRHSSDEIIQKVLTYCSENYQEGSLSALAESLYINPSYLSQLIKQKTSKTFSDLLNEARMKQAALFLKNPSTKIYNVSTMIGYVNPNNFARAFKAYWGVTPTEYRNHEK